MQQKGSVMGISPAMLEEIKLEKISI